MIVPGDPGEPELVLAQRNTRKQNILGKNLDCGANNNDSVALLTPVDRKFLLHVQ